MEVVIMKVLIVYAHPNPQSFNRAVLDAFTDGLAGAGHTFEVVDLYGINFEACLSGEDLTKFMEGRAPDDIQTQQEKLSQAEGLVLIHPVWWRGPPAILKGWIDRVFSFGFAYVFDEKDGHPIGLLKHKKAMIINTAGANEENAKRTGLTEALRLTEVEGILRFCGIGEVQHIVFYNMTGSDDMTRKGYLEESRSLGQGF
jgi:NAD(P)H dehydrogenase (quinone)